MRNWKQHEKAHAKNSMSREAHRRIYRCKCSWKFSSVMCAVEAHAELEWRLFGNEKYETETIDRDKIT